MAVCTTRSGAYCCTPSFSEGKSKCSRFCVGQSTNDPQGSTGLGVDAVNYSIISTYFQQISTGFNKRCDLFWEQRAGGSNPSAPTMIISGLHDILISARLGLWWILWGICFGADHIKHTNCLPVRNSVV